jgi:hypothetical protein
MTGKTEVIGSRISTDKGASRELQSCEERFLAALPVQGGTYPSRRDEAGRYSASLALLAVIC